MGFYVEDGDFPAVFNPVQYLPFRNNHAESSGFQLRPGTWDALAEWCGGVKAVVDGGQAVTLPNGQTAVLGDFVMFDGDTYRIEPADGAANRLWPRDQADEEDGAPPPLFPPASD